MSDKLVETIEKHQTLYGVRLDAAVIKKLAEYHQLVEEQNSILHLVAPSAEEEFATRHVLESLTLLEYLPRRARFADVGTGAGLPSIPCLLAREDLRGFLIESKLKKAAFLEKVLTNCDLADRANIINRQFEEISKPQVSFVTCRALDKFTQKLPKLLRWAKGSTILFFGGNSLRAELQKNRVIFSEKLMPFSEQRYLFIGKI